MRTFLGLIAFLCLTASSHSQSCPNPKESSDALEPSSLHGTVLYHDELRHWLGFKLDQPACGQSELELVFSDQNAWRRAQSLQRCSANVTGKIYYGETGYYSSEMAIRANTLQPDPSCQALPVVPDPATTRMPKNLRLYRASITINLQGLGHSEIKVWRNQKQQLPLNPWEYYVNYLLNGGRDVVRFGCREGFLLRDIRQSPKAAFEATPDDPNWVSATLTGESNFIDFVCEKKHDSTQVTDQKPPKKKFE